MEPEITETAQTELLTPEKTIAKRLSRLLPTETAFFMGYVNSWKPGLDAYVLTTERLVAYLGTRIVYTALWGEIEAHTVDYEKRGIYIKSKGRGRTAFVRMPPADLSALQAALETFGVNGPGPESWQQWINRRPELQAPLDAEVARVTGEKQQVADGRAAAKQAKDDAQRAQWAQDAALKAKSKEYTWPNTRVPNGRPNSATSLVILRACREEEEPWFILTSAGAGSLVAFDDRLMIIKKGVMQGFMAGTLGGERSTTFYFTDITAIEFNSGMLSGVLEVLTGSYQGTANKDYWQGATKSRNADSNDPYTLSNTLPLSKFIYHEARNEIRDLQERISAAKRPATLPSAHAPAPADLAAQLAQLGQLRDSGVLSDEEFAAAKGRVLGGPNA